MPLFPRRSSTSRASGRALVPCLVVLSFAGSYSALAVGGEANGKAPRGRAIHFQRADTAVRLAARPRHAGIATLVEELSIGAENGAAEYTFTSVGKVLPLRDGTLLVQDGISGGRGTGTTFIRQYDASGRYIRSFGRTGQGPGEYTQPRGLAQLSDGRVLVLDNGQNKIIVYSPQGQYVEQRTIVRGLIGPSTMEEPLIADTAGYIYRAIAARARATGESPFTIPLAYERSLSDGRIVDSIMPPTFPTGTVMGRALFTAFRSPGSSVSMYLHYWPEPFWTISPLGYVITGVPSRYAVDLRIPVAGDPAIRPRWKEGDRVVSIRREVPPVPVIDAERAQHRAMITTILKLHQPDWTWKAPDIPRVKPAYSLLKAALDGRIWVLVAQPSVPRVPPLADPAGCEPCKLHFKETNVVDIFEPDGTYVGQVRMSDSVRFYSMVLRGDNAWGVVKGPNDVPLVKRWRIAWP